MPWKLYQSDARKTPLADKSVHCVITSPPYYGLRDYGTDGQLGLEKTPEEYVANMVEVFREVRRVMRDDATLWLNIGDSYASVGKHGGSTGGKHAKDLHGRSAVGRQVRDFGDLKGKDRIGIPHMLVFALRADGWYWRDEIVWGKPNPMPESITDRTTKSHEFLFLLTKSPRYFYDADAIREPVTSTGGACVGKQKISADGTMAQSRKMDTPAERNHPMGRNKRSVWTVPTHSFPGAHFATFPPRLIEPCVRAGTSEKGCCPACGAPWKRVVDKVRDFASGSGRAGNMPVGKNGAGMQGGGETKDIRRGPIVSTVTTHWVPTCACNAGDPVPCTIYDPFNGAATTGVVAIQNGRDYVGTEINPEYLTMSEERLAHAMANPPKAKRPKRAKAQAVGQGNLFAA